MGKLAQVPLAIQKVMQEDVQIAGVVSEFDKRDRKLNSRVFVQTLVFGWMSNPAASLVELTQTAAMLGVEVSPQALDQRFSEEATSLLRQVLNKAVRQAIKGQPASTAILQRFNAVYIEDGSVVRLPDELKDIWQGCGGSKSEGLQSAVKLEVRLNYKNGEIFGPHLMDARAHESQGYLQRKERLTAGSLWLADLAYFSLDRLAQLTEDGVYWLTRVKGGTGVVDLAGKSWQLDAFLAAQKRTELAIEIKLGVSKQLLCRLFAVRVPGKVASERRRRLRDKARRKCQEVTKQSLELAKWTVYVTNAPAKLMNLAEALVLARTRWQVELLFKLWKSHGQIDKSCSKKPMRILCEFYAKLIAMLIQHWILITNCWHFPDRSLMKAAKTVQKFAFFLAAAINSEQLLSWVISLISNCLAAGCRINKRLTSPSHFQLLLAEALN
jgi:hypothetical protein